MQEIAIFKEVPRIPETGTNGAGHELFHSKLSSLLSFERVPFDEEIYAEQQQDRPGMFLDEVLNRARWRFADDGQLESNTRFVKWSDGSMTCHIGQEEAFAVERVPTSDSRFLYAPLNEGSTLGCQGRLLNRLAFAPISNRAILYQRKKKMRVQKARSKDRRIILVRPDKNRMDEETMKKIQRQQRRMEAAQKRKMDKAALTAAFLEGGAYSGSEASDSESSDDEAYQRKRKKSFGTADKYGDEDEDEDEELDAIERLRKDREKKKRRREALRGQTEEDVDEKILKAKQGATPAPTKKAKKAESDDELRDEQKEEPEAKKPAKTTKRAVVSDEED